MSVFTPQGAPTAPVAPPAAPAVEEETGGNSQRQRLLFILGGALALALVGFLAYHFLFSGNGSAAAPPVPVHNPSVSAATSGSSTAKGSTTPAAPLKTHSGTARNPFKALVLDNTTSGGTGSSSSSASSTGTSGTSSSGSTSSGTSTGTTATSTSSVPLRLTLKSVTGTSSASVWVYNTKTKKTAKYAPKIGDTFGTYFRLTGFLTDTKTGAKAALIEYGDTILTLIPGTTDTVQ